MYVADDVQNTIVRRRWVDGAWRGSRLVIGDAQYGHDDCLGTCRTFLETLLRLNRKTAMTRRQTNLFLTLMVGSTHCF